MSPDFLPNPLPSLSYPRKRDLLRIPLWPLEVSGFPKALSRTTPSIVGSPTVIVVPGLWASDRTMWALRKFLTQSGYRASGWGLGRNRAGRGWTGDLSDLSDGWAKNQRDRKHAGEGNVPALCDQFTSVVREHSSAIGSPIALVGWSLGGFVAREAARDLPEHVSQVITLGSPLVGGPKYSLLNKRYRRKGVDVDWISSETIARHERPIQCPVVSIYSKHDAIVHWSASIDRWTPDVRHYEVGCTHTALAFHAPTLRIVKQELDRVHNDTSKDFSIA